MNQLLENIAQIARERKLERDFVISKLKEAVLLTFKKKYGPDYEIDVKIDLKTGKFEINVVKKVVEEVKDPAREISLEEAREIDPEIQPGTKIWLPLSIDSLSRGLVLKILERFQQMIREAEKVRIYRDFQNRIGELIKARVWRVDKTGVYVNVGTEAIIPPNELIPGEKIKPRQMIYAIILDVDRDAKKRPQVILSRSHPDFVRKMMEHEIPEVADGTVEIRAVARIAGKRSKVAVRSKDPRIDPVGACIGMKGMRIKPVSKELADEKIDVVHWYPDTIRMAVSALSPVVPIMVYEKDDKVYAVVKDEDVATAKGTEGMNVILASKLVGKEIVIVPESEYEKPKGVLTIMDLKFDSPDIVEKLKKGGFYIFTELPLLADLINKANLDERTAMKVLKIIEDALEKMEEK